MPLDLQNASNTSSTAGSSRVHSGASNHGVPLPEVFESSSRAFSPSSSEFGDRRASLVPHSARSRSRDRLSSIATTSAKDDSYVSISDEESLLDEQYNFTLSTLPDYDIDLEWRSRQSSQLDNLPYEILTYIVSYLPPSSIASLALVSRNLYALIADTHTWQAAFLKYFPGAETVPTQKHVSQKPGWSEFRQEGHGTKRSFARLCELSSWRTEYIVRTRLLRSLARGRPMSDLPPGGNNGSNSPSSHSGRKGNANVDYNAGVLTPVTRIEAHWGSGLNHRHPVFIHATDETGHATVSEPRAARIQRWGTADPVTFLQFVDKFPSEPQYGLGSFDIVGLPNIVDVSQPNGMIYAEGFPAGRIYFRACDEHRGRFLAQSVNRAKPELGIPAVPCIRETPTAAFICKGSNIPQFSNGLIGMLSGSSLGVVTAYSLGLNSISARTIERGEPTAKWILSPGVPIVAFALNDSFSQERMSDGRAWAFALNALGEIFYLNRFPDLPVLESRVRLTAEETDQIAWQRGRALQWEMIEGSRRQVRDDLLAVPMIDPSYSPRSSSVNTFLGPDQLRAETHEIQDFISRNPAHFRGLCKDWNMQRRLEADFGGHGMHDAGESCFVIATDQTDDKAVKVRRFVRFRISGQSENDSDIPGLDLHEPLAKPEALPASDQDVESSRLEPYTLTGTSVPSTFARTSKATHDMWRISDYVFPGAKGHITASAVDNSRLSRLRVSEDPLLTLFPSSTPNSPTHIPLKQRSVLEDVSAVPGYRGRFIAIGTSTGNVVIWDMRAPHARIAQQTSTVLPVRVINTDSPQITSLALNALYVVHGGNDGLVQAWDPLGSSDLPIRTLNSRFSSKARRRLNQAEATPEGVGLNYFAAGALCIDNDPTVLRGIVAIGTHLRFWSYSSSSQETRKGNKRRLRRGGDRSTTDTAEKFSSTGRSAIDTYIASERAALIQETNDRQKEHARMAGRFGVDLLGPGASEADMLAYAKLLSEESQPPSSEDLANEGAKPASSSSEFGPPPSAEAQSAQIGDDSDLQEAIKRSLAEATAIHSSSLASDGGHEGSASGNAHTPVMTSELDDLAYALQLSQVEAASMQDEEAFPPLGSPQGSTRGKGKARSIW